MMNEDDDDDTPVVAKSVFSFKEPIRGEREIIVIKNEMKGKK